MGEWQGAETVARGQLGLVTRRQLDAVGIGPWALKWGLRSGRLERLYANVYRFVMSELTWHQRALGAAMLREEGSALSHQSAGFLFRLDGVGDHPPSPIDLSVAGRDRLRATGVTAHHPRLPFLIVRRGLFPVTSLARTLLDLAGVLDPARLELALDSAHRRAPRLLQWLNETIAPLHPRQHRGLATLRELLSVRTPQASDSALEVAVLRALRRHRVERPMLQHQLTDVMRIDFAWPRQRVALHVDGFRWHDGRRAFDHDAAQRSRLAALDWVSIVVTSKTLNGAAWLTALDAALARRAPQLELLRVPTPRR